MTTNEGHLSVCCHAPLIVIGRSEAYRCQRCGQKCEAYYVEDVVRVERIRRRRRGEE